ncbi:hypothetical protein DPMN_105492 [Dreissena polymorpha]|uniref:Uncharacterized protein n=1 Tax=Dreissena polymorpha TaxID=45954 RepID=A0A9D4K3A5_DREPO|nr:hypothetical protein DPMN_105492 [Dreissena polymorpha]
MSGPVTGQWSVLPVTGHRSILQTGHRTPVNMHRSLTGQQLRVAGQRSETDVLLHRIIPLLHRRMHICRRLVPIIEVDVGHALIHRAVLIPIIVMIMIDHLDHNGKDTRGDVIPVVAVLALGVVAVLDLGITRIKVVDKFHGSIVVPTFMTGHITILFLIVMSPYPMHQFAV